MGVTRSSCVLRQTNQSKKKKKKKKKDSKALAYMAMTSPIQRSVNMNIEVAYVSENLPETCTVGRVTVNPSP